MRTVRLALLGLSICLLAACEAADPTAPSPLPVAEEGGKCGYLGSSGC